MEHGKELAKESAGCLFVFFATQREWTGSPFILLQAAKVKWNEMVLITGDGDQTERN